MCRCLSVGFLLRESLILASAAFTSSKHKERFFNPDAGGGGIVFVTGAGGLDSSSTDGVFSSWLAGSSSWSKDKLKAL